MQELKINGYILAPLRSVQKDDIQTLLGNDRGVYLCNYPDKFWHNSHNFIQKKQGNVYKKKRIFELMGKGSHILGWTNINEAGESTKNLKNGPISHFGNCGIHGRVGKLIITLKMIFWMVKHRKHFNYSLINNFSFPFYFAALFSKYVLGKVLYVDFQDDYTLRDKATWKNGLFNLIKHTPDKVICINKHMENHFEDPSIETYVFNGFIDLSYAENLDFTLKEGMVFLFGGRLDKIRGVDLIPELIYSLRKKLSNFKIIVAGAGPLEKEMRAWNFQELKMVGFLSGDDYQQKLSEADAYLVLQKPDLPFSKGSFPSKIEYYAKFKKPIYHLIESKKEEVANP